MAFNWTLPTLTVDGKVGIGTDTPSQELDVIGNISAANLNLNGSLTINENLSVGGNFQLGTLSINAFSSDGNLADNSNLAVPTEQAVKTYVDNQITQVNNALDTKAALNGAADQNFTAQNLTVEGNLQVSGNLEVQGDVIARDTEHIAGNVSLGDEDSDVITIAGVVSSGHSSGAVEVNSALHTTGSLTVDGSLSVGNAIATSELNATGTIQANRFEGDGSALTGINPGKWSDGSSGSIYYNNGNVGIGTSNPSAKLEVAGALKLATTGTQIFYSTNESGTPTGDGFRLRYDNNFFGTNQDALVIEKTDGNNPNPDGGIAFVNTGNDGVVETALVIKGNGNVGIGTTSPASGAKLDVRGNLYVGGQGAILVNNYVHRAQSTDDNRYGYFEVRRKNNQRGLYLGWGSPGKYVDLRLEEGNALAITGGKVGIGTNTPKSTQHIVGDLVLGKDVNNQKFIFHSRTNGNGDFLHITSDNSSGGWDWSKGIMFFRNGDVRIRGRLLVNNIPFGDRRNMQWDNSSKLFYHDNSSRKTKENIQSLEDDFTKILQVAPKTYTRPGDAEHWEIGYIAEEFHELGLNQLVYYDEDGSPGAINYRKISMYLVEVVKDLEQKLQQYERRLNQLEKSV
ncbi:MAG: tail fiber domain-containing protein [Moorea sp. SIO4A3]|nr:tail fiber domain-containing protein [Moorena sp. SIO4A3]